MLTTGCNFFPESTLLQTEKFGAKCLNFFTKLLYRYYSKMSKWQEHI